MLISLKIDNVDRLSNGGPLSFQARDRSFEIGRESPDWALPDPDRFISGRHCEIRYQANAFWLYDVSRNGTFVNGGKQRIDGPHRLGSGDRIQIGRYLISVAVEGGLRRPAEASEPVQDDPFLLVRSARAPAGAAAAPARPSASRPAPSGDTAALLRAIAAGAGVSPELFAQRDPVEVATEIGTVLRMVVGELALLLRARAAAKVLARNADRTMVSPTENNPLKLVPDTDELLDILFGRRRAGYLDAGRAFEEAFHDLKTHEFATYAAMQAALARLLDDLSPDAIERKLPPSSFMSKKGRAWDVFVATWEAREDAHENGMLDVFLAFFSEAYAKAAKSQK